MNLTHRQVLDAAPDAMVVVDENGAIVLINQQAEALFGYTRDELVGQSVEMLLPKRFQDRHPQHRQEFIHSDRVRLVGQRTALYGQRKDGTEFPTEISLSRIESEQGVFVASAIRDVTDRVKLNERRFRAIFQQKHQLAGILDLEGTLIDANELSLTFSSLSRAEVIKKPFWETGWWTHDTQLQEQLKTAITSAVSGETVSFEATHPLPDGSLATVDFSIRPVRDEHGTVAFLVAESHDTTERKQVERALQESHELLEERVKLRTSELEEARKESDLANTGKSRFLAAASHDLRQPLQSLGLYLSVMTRLFDQPDGADSTKLKDIGGKLRKSLDTMGELLDALLDISRLDGGSITPEKRDVHIQELLDRIVTDNIQQAEEKGLELICTHDDVVVHSDPALLERIIENFVTNAIRYTESGRVSIECRVSEGTATISISDTGIGIPKAALDNIFEEYYQLDNAVRDRRKGLGLGLSIVKHIARLLDHSLEVTSIVGRGSTFSLDVPLGISNPQRIASSNTFQTLQGSREFVVLLVDDDPSIVDATTMLLESAGVVVHSAFNGDEALTHVAAGVRPDLVVSDYRLPRYDGVEVVRRIRRATSDDLPTVLMTGDTSAKEIEAANLSNCTVLHKPVDTDRLISLIESLTA